MKTMTNVIAWIFVGATFVSCTREVGIGEVSTEVREVATFSKIELSNSADVEIIPGDTLLVEVSDYENLLNNIEVETRGNTLVIKNKPLRVALRNSCAKVKISMPGTLSSIAVSGSGNVDVRECVSKSVTVTISGSGNVTASSSANLESITTEISGMGNVAFQGTGNSVVAIISGSGNVQFKDFVSNQTDCTISGSGDMKTHTLDELNVTISGSGNITYYGNPGVNTRISGSGKITHKNN